MNSRTTENIVENLPSNVQIQKGIEHARKEIHAARTAPGVDLTGHQILTDTEQVLSSTQTFITEKNEGDKVQRLIREGQKATAELQAQANILRQAGTPSIDTEHLKELAERTLETARLAGMEIMTSASFRRSLADFVLLCYDLVAEGTGLTEGSAQSKLRAKRKIKSAIAPSSTTSTTTTATSTTGLAGTTAPSLGTTTTGAAPSTTGLRTTTTGAEPTLKEQASDNIEGAINKGLRAAGSTKRVRLSKEQLNDLMDRFIDLMRNISQRERSKAVFIALLDMFRLFSHQVTEATTTSGENVINKAERSAAALKYNKHVQKTLALSQELFEQFTGDKSLDPLLFHIRKINHSLRRDSETRRYFEDLRTYIMDLLNHPELFDDVESSRRGRRLIKRGRKLHDDKLYSHLRGSLDEMTAIIQNIQDDPATRKVRTDMKRLIEDILLDSEGNIVLKEHVLQQLRLIIVSSIIERMRLPLPTIHMEDESMEYTLRNLVVSIRDLVPDRVVLENRGRLALDFTDVRQPEVETASNTVRIVIQNINIHMEQADIAFHRKTFPRVTDRGKLRMDIGGKGMDIVIQLNIFARSRNFFRVEFVDCDVHNLSFYLHDTRHDWLYNSVLKLLSGRIKTRLEAAIENNLTNHLDQLNRLLTKQLRRTKQLTMKGGSTTSSITSAIKAGAHAITGGGL